MSDREMLVRRLPANFPKKGGGSAKHSACVQETCITLTIRNTDIRRAPYSILLEAREREGGKTLQKLVSCITTFTRCWYKRNSQGDHSTRQALHSQAHHSITAQSVFLQTTWGGGEPTQTQFRISLHFYSPQVKSVCFI